MVPPRTLSAIADHCNQWSNGHQIRIKILSGRYIFISTESDCDLIRRYGIGVGERVRTPIGLAELRGVAFNRLWFTFTEIGSTWFFSNHQIKSGREQGYFTRCSYELEDVHTPTPPVPSGLNFDVFSLQEIMDPVRWPDEIDSALVSFLVKLAEAEGVSVWSVTCDKVSQEYRSLQSQLSRLIMNDSALSHRWGISGPKRKAVIARLGLLRYVNHELDLYLPSLLASGESTLSVAPAAVEEKYTHPEKKNDDFFPVITSIKIAATSIKIAAGSSSGGQDVFQSSRQYEERGGGSGSVCSVETWRGGGGGSRCNSGWECDEDQSMDSLLPFPVASPLISTSWRTLDFSTLWTDGSGLIPISKHRIFPDIKIDNFRSCLSRSGARPTRTDDDYDYPDDLPTVKINRFKSFRAKEAAELMGLSGEDVFSSSLFCQLWMELREVSNEKLRMSYSHPMDDGQSRTFKVTFNSILYSSVEFISIYA